MALLNSIRSQPTSPTASRLLSPLSPTATTFAVPSASFTTSAGAAASYALAASVAPEQSIISDRASHWHAVQRAAASHSFSLYALSRLYEADPDPPELASYLVYQLWPALHARWTALKGGVSAWVRGHRWVAPTAYFIGATSLARATVTSGWTTIGLRGGLSMLGSLSNQWAQRLTGAMARLTLPIGRGGHQGLSRMVPLALAGGLYVGYHYLRDAINDDDGASAGPTSQDASEISDPASISAWMDRIERITGSTTTAAVAMTDAALASSSDDMSAYSYEVINHEEPVSPASTDSSGTTITPRHSCHASLAGSNTSNASSSRYTSARSHSSSSWASLEPVPLDRFESHHQARERGRPYPPSHAHLSSPPRHQEPHQRARLYAEQEKEETMSAPPPARLNLFGLYLDGLQSRGHSA